MDRISSDIVEKTWEKMGKMSPSKAPKMMNRMLKQQPIILNYLMASGDDIFNQEEREFLLYLGVVVWQIMSQGSTPIPEVSENVLDEVENLNIKILEHLEEESESGFIETVDEIMSRYNQTEVLRYVLEAIVEEAKEGNLIRDEMTGVIFLHLKTVIDCFDR